MNAYIRHYVLSGLRATPRLYSQLLEGMTDQEADHRPDPERFTLREMMAHMADWETIFRERGERIRDEEIPYLPGYDEGQLALERNYAAQPVSETLERFIAGREALLAFFEGLRDSDWSRLGNRDEIGMISLGDLATMILGHDGYHALQIMDYRRS